MFKKSLVLVALVLSSFAPAAQGAERVLLELQLSGGFGGPVLSYRFMITTEGRMAKIVNRTAPIELGRLSPAVLDSLKKEVASLKVGAKLEQLDPNAPECADAPSYTYAGYPSEGKKAVFFAVQNCRQSASSQGSVYTFKEILDGVQGLGNLLR